MASGAGRRFGIDTMGTAVMLGPDVRSTRARKARMSTKLGSRGIQFSLVFCFALLAAGALIALQEQVGYCLIGLGLIVLSITLWGKRDLLPLPADGNDLTGRLSADVLAKLPANTAELDPRSLWKLLSSNWQFIFFANHLLLPNDFVAEHLSDDTSQIDGVWQTAMTLADQTGSQLIEPGHIAAALFQNSPAIAELLTHMKHNRKDIDAILGWLMRDLFAMRRTKQNFGGIGRDWANGFTPRLNQFGENVSIGIEKHGLDFGSLATSPAIDATKKAFGQGASAVALIGPEGIGKTSHGYALAQSILAEHTDRSLEHHQLISLNAGHIISSASRPGDLEYIVTALLNEAAHAGNIVLFLDDAQLFMNSGTGTFDATQILLPVMQSRRVRFVLAMTPQDFQRLKSNNSAFANLLTPVVIKEPDEAQTLESLTRVATNYEIRQKVLIAYEALQEAYKLSGRYDQDLAYPGKAIRLLEQAIAYGNNGVVNAVSVQEAIEQTRGVKVGASKPAEADQLLNLESLIHSRMINQARAVSVVSNALRRARAGVSNPNRPIGSFLFLGPTGVGKTELAKSVAAVYFGNEASMIRLDMSEYQQNSDVSRLLSTGASETSSLLLRIREQPFSVVLLDEIEKAHPNVLNLLLQLLDEGKLTDEKGRAASFKDAVIIATSNAGADSIRAHIEKGEELEQFEKPFIDELIGANQFKPELLNRFDEIVLFRPLNPDELAQVVRLMLVSINQTLAAQNISVNLTEAAIAAIVEHGNDPRLGARPMRRTLQKAVEDTVAKKILAGETNPGDTLTLDVDDLSLS